MASTNITINVVEPATPPSPVPIESGTSIPVPDTGLFTHGIGAQEATIIGVSIVAILALIAFIVIKRKSLKSLLKTNKHLVKKLFMLATVVSLATLTGLFFYTGKANINAIENELTVEANSVDLTIEVSDKPVFAYLPVELTVKEATEAGYTLTAYTENTDLVSTTDQNNKIPMITVNEEELTNLEDNTYGLSLNKPESQEDIIYTSLSTDSDSATVLKTVDDYAETLENDTTTIYYGFYITPDLPVGTYTNNSEIIYEADKNIITTITFNGNDNDGGEDIDNVIINGGETSPLPQNTFTRTNYIFNGWNTVQNPTEDNPGTHYDNEADFTASATNIENITLHAQWLNTTAVSFDGNGSTSGNMDSVTVIEDTPQNLPQNIFTKTNATFIGWNTLADGTGESYIDEAEYIVSATSSHTVTLYAQWASTTITFNGNGADSGSMSDFIIAAGATSTLPQDTFTRANYVFNGWNTNQDGTGTSYNDQANFTATSSTSQNITLYAQWKPITTISFNGNGSTSGSMNAITLIGGNEQSLPQNTFARNGYLFTGWNTNQDGTGTSYDDEASYIASTTNVNNITLYAQWQELPIMQNVSEWGNTLNEHDTVLAVDKRDYKTYYVTKMKDGKIWMTQNLDLDLNINKTLTPADTDVSQSWTPERSTIFTVSGASASGWVHDVSNPYSADPGELYVYSSSTTNNDTQFNSLEACQAEHPDCSQHNHAGNYYNWTASIASNDSSGIYVRYNNTVTSICPAGWRLPTGRDSSNTATSREFNALLYAEGIMNNPISDGYAINGLDNIRKSPLWFVRPGNVSYGSLNNVGGGGIYWSSTAYNSNSAYGLYFDSNSVEPASTDVRYSGYPIRCIAKQQRITFDGNGSDGGSMNDINILAGSTITLPANSYTKEGYAFVSWNTAEDGSGTSYQDQAEYAANTEQPGNIILYAQWTDCLPNSICYKANGANEGESDPKMGAQTKNYNDNTNTITSNMEVNLWPPNYKYDTNNDGYNDYGFAGWSEDKNAATKILDTDGTNDPTIYGPNQNITLGDVSTKGLKLYAVWMPVAKDSTNTELTFQTTDLLTTTLADGTTLASKSNGYVTALKDQRDDQVYAVAKLADGNYWMIENLRLDNNPDQPNWGDNALSQGFDGAFVGLANVESTNFTFNTKANSLYNTSNITGSNQYYRFPRYNNINTTTSTANMTAYDNKTNVYSLGNYYTWAAAIADTTGYEYNGSHANIKTSICPAGWHLPYGNNGTSDNNIGNISGGFYYLGDKIDGIESSAASSKAWRVFPNNFMYSGLFRNSAADGRAEYGCYWSTSAKSIDDAYELDFEKNYVRPGTSSLDKYHGFAVRCVVGE